MGKMCDFTFDNNISEAIRFVGVADKTLDLFESQYEIPNGVMYNSYVILDEKTVLMDTVDARGMEEWEKNVADVLAGRPLDYLVIQHLEPDHSGSIGRALELYPDVTLVTNDKVMRMLPQFFALPEGLKTLIVKEGDTLNIGAHTLAFVMAPMVHWPEVMVTYEATEKVLFAADGFGSFGTLDQQEEDWACEGRRYFINIVGKHGAAVQKLLAKAATLDIATIAPLHGPVLRENLGYYIGLYDTWSSYRPEDKGVFIPYASIHGNTAKAAKKFAEILEAKGEKNVVLCDLARDDMSEAVEDAYRYDCMVLAAATYDGGIFLCMKDFIAHLEAKLYQNRTVGFIENGSWGPQAGKIMKKSFEAMKDITMVDPMVTIKSTMKDADIAKMEELADAIIAR